MKKFMKRRSWARVLSVVLAAVLLISNLETGAFVHAAESNAIEIKTAEDLQKIGTDADHPMTGDYVLTNDIDLSGIKKWEPMGGHLGIKGTCDPSQANVFSGTFDGQGHVISGLTIDLSDSINQQDKYGQVGLFSVIGSNKANDPAQVKNLIFADVDIHTDFPNGLATVGTLAGEVNGYADISGIVVLDGTLVVNPSAKCDTVGVGGVIGECRTADAIGNANISVKDCYNGADVYAYGTVENLIYTAGIVGRVAKSKCKSITQCVNVGMVQYEGYDAFAIASAEHADATLLSTLTDCYVLSSLEQLIMGGVTEVSAKNLTSGTLPGNLSADTWKAEAGCYPVPAFCLTSSAAGRIYLSGLSLEFAEGETASEVKTEISLPQTAGNDAIAWSSNNETALTIEGEKAVAHPDAIGMNTTVVLTAESARGYSRSFKIVVVSDNTQEASFQFGAGAKANYAKVGVPLSVSVSNLEEGTELTYKWRIDGTVIPNTSNSYTPSENDLEKFISVEIATKDNSVKWNLSTYCSELPVIYVDTNDGLGVNSNTTAKDAVISVQGNDEFNDSKTWYSGKTTIKGRGNSTWSEAVAWGVKKPYKLKLDKKANMLGLGTNNEQASKNTNKHWVLLANMIDHTNMRNEIAYNFSKDIGMEVSMGTTNVVLILNGEYQGIYELAEHVRIGSARVNVQDWEDLADDIADAIAADICAANAALKLSDVESDLEDAMEQDYSWLTSGTVTYKGVIYRVSDHYKKEIPEFTGGFLLDMDFRSLSNQFKYISTFRTQYGDIPMFFRSPEYAKTSDTMMSYTKNYLNAYEAALRSPDFTTEYNGQTVHYTDLFDMDSLLQYWLLCEYVINWDSMKNSTYLYKDLEGKAKMGPAWDYDWAWGNINMYSMTGPFVYNNWHTTLCGMDAYQGGFAENGYQKEQWNRYLVKDPYFVTKAYEIYKKYRPTVIEDIMKDDGTIDTLEKKYQTASEKNDEKWSYSYSRYRGNAFVNGVLQTGISSQLYAPAVASLKTFIQKRIGWMDGQFTSVNDLYRSLGNSVSTQISVATPSEGTDGTVTATATVKDSNAVYVVFLVNGKKVLIDDGAKIPVSNGQASVTISKDMLLGNVLNTIEVLGVNNSGNYISGLMNFTTFEGPEVILEGEVQVSSDREGDKSYPGDTLTAAATITGDIVGNLTYQWYADDEEIKGATRKNYILTEAEIGKTVGVKVGSTVEAGTLNMDYAGTVEAKPTVLEGTVTITADPKREGDVSYPGDTLQAKVSDDNNTGDLSYQWYADGKKIKGATKKKYVLTIDEIGKTLSIEVSSDEQSGTLSKIYNGTVIENPETEPDPKPEKLTGNVSVTSDSTEAGKSYPENTLMAEVSGTNNTGALKYQWYAGETAISGATGSTYKLTEAEIGKAITVKVTSTEETGELTGTYNGTVVAKQGTTPPEKKELTGNVSVTSDSTEAGKSYPDDTLTAEVSDSNYSGTLEYQWYANGSKISEATGNTYKLTMKEVGKAIMVKVTSTEETGELTGMYEGLVAEKQGTIPPEKKELTGNVSVTSDSKEAGKSHPDDTLTAEVNGSNHTGTLEYQWYAGEDQISGATKSTYRLTEAEIGKTITVKVTSTEETGELTGTYEGTVAAKEGPGKEDPVKANGIKLSVKSKKMYAYQTLQLKATVKPAGVSQSVTYSSSKKSVATVSKTGKVTAKAPGTTTIRVTAKDGSGVSVTCKIMVQKPKITVSGKSSVKRKKSITLTAKTYGLKGTVKWSLNASGKKLLKLNKTKGNKVKLTAKNKTGKAKLTVTCGKKKVTKTIRVKK